MPVQFYDSGMIFIKCNTIKGRLNILRFLVGAFRRKTQTIVQSNSDKRNTDKRNIRI